MKFEVWPAGNFWEVGFFKDKNRMNWVGLKAFSSQAEADAERFRLIGGNTPPVNPEPVSEDME
ncbi:hypothetical protein [Acinetobacter sp. ANC 3813]|uniref:hypothetical protein n=1 Tax=Acinetobacter sp. ANC 3813 TaxID=1977873 RepID=UPI000A334C5F|nr:hypothetical protein [Acinetobacter sp. ANC 3813]OTG87868.1 hypothetical protein B9T34_16155 [Acinetobacter sp. ANC 3813]